MWAWSPTPSQEVISSWQLPRKERSVFISEVTLGILTHTLGWASCSEVASQHKCKLASIFFLKRNEKTKWTSSWVGNKVRDLGEVEVVIQSKYTEWNYQTICSSIIFTKVSPCSWSSTLWRLVMLSISSHVYCTYILSLVMYLFTTFAHSFHGLGLSVTFWELLEFSNYWSL